MNEPPFNPPVFYPEHGSNLPLPPPPPQNSGLATASLIVGMVSLVVFCCPPFSTIGSIFAVITGHVSLSTIKKSDGRITGAGSAISGLIVGYIGIGLTIALIVWSAIREINRDPGEKRFDVAERKFNELDDGTASGPSEEEARLAKMTLEMAELKNKEELFIGQLHFSVWCEIHGEQVVFLIYSCQLEELDAEIHYRLWESAIEALRDSKTLPPGSRVAVAVQEYFSFDVGLFGTLQMEGEPRSLIERTLKSNLMDDSRLYPYFREPDDPPE